MTTIRVDPDGMRSVAAAIDAVGEQLWRSSRSVIGATLGQAALGALAGFGLNSALVAGQSELLALRLTEQAVRMRGEAETATAWGQALLGSQVVQTAARDWRAILGGADKALGVAKKPLDVGQVGLDVRTGRHWFNRAKVLARKGTLGAHARRWKAFGSYNRAFSKPGFSAVSAAGDFVQGAGGGLLSAVGDLGGAVLTVRKAYLHPVQLRRVAGFIPRAATSKVLGNPTAKVLGKVLGKVALPLAVLQSAASIHDLTHSDLNDLRAGDAAQHSTAARQAIYAAKVADTIGSVLLLGAFIPGFALAGGVLIGASALVRGAIFLNDLSHQPGPVNDAAHALAPTTDPAWSRVRHLWRNPWQ